jgi:ribosomal-protein-alanine N-acetyltransferase
VDSIAAVELSTPRLKLRYPTGADAPALLTLASDPEVTRFFSWGPYRSLEEPEAYVARLAGERERGARLEFLILGESGPIGVTGLSEFSRRDRRAVVGTWLGREHWGSGANGASKAVIAWLAFERLGLERLGAYADVDNPRSQAALLKLGFAREGVLRRWHRHGDGVHDVVLHSWLKEEWECSPLSREPVEMRGMPPEAFRRH